MRGTDAPSPRRSRRSSRRSFLDEWLEDADDDELIGFLWYAYPQGGGRVAPTQVATLRRSPRQG